MTTIAATAPGDRELHLAHSPSVHVRRTAPSVRAVRAAITALAVLCSGLHAWVAVTAPDWRSLAMLGLAAVCAACLVHRAETSRPSTGEWGVMAVAALAMLVVHLTGAGAASGHHAALVTPAGADASATSPEGAVHTIAVGVAAAEFGIAMLALVVCGIRRRARREGGTPVP